MTTLHKTSEKILTVYVKGALEIILERCTHVLQEGKVKKLSAQEKKAILEVN